MRRSPQITEIRNWRRNIYLYALLTQDDSLILKLFEKMNIQGQLLINRVDQAIGKRPKVQGGQHFRRAGSEQCV